MKRRSYDRRSRLAAAEETRRRIVRATVELHAEHGALGTSHEMIAERAQVSLPTVYKYFPTRNDLIPHCTGLALAAAPPQLDAAALEAIPDAPARLRALARGTFAFYEYAAPWLRWSARDAGQLPALRAVLDEAARARLALIRTALAPAFDRSPPRRLVALAAVLLDFPAWQTLTEAGFTRSGAASAAGDALDALLASNSGRSTLPEEEP